MGAKKHKLKTVRKTTKKTKVVSNSWFHNLPAEKQHEYCKSLKGKRKSKYCTFKLKPKKSGVLGVVDKEDGKYYVDPDGQGVMNFGYEEDSKQLQLTDEKTELKLVPTENESDKEEDKKDQIKKTRTKTTKVEDHEYYDREGEHKWAKIAKLKNMGEDVEGAARHQRNAIKDWNSDEAFVNLDIKINKDVLLERNGVDLATENEAAMMNNYALKLILDSFPQTVSYAKGGDLRDAKLARRKLFIETFNDFCDEVRKRVGRESGSVEKDLYELSAILKAYSEDLKGKPYGDLLAKSLRAKARSLLSGKNSPRYLMYKAQEHVRGLIKAGSDVGTGEFGSGYRQLNDNEISLIKKSPESKNFMKRIISGEVNLKAARVSRKTGFEVKGLYANNKSFEISGSNHKYNTKDKAVSFFSKNARAVQFGNGLTEKEREGHIINCAKSLEDLAKITGISDKKWAMDGKLAFSFAARGHSNAAAHYEPGKTKIVNLSRKSGFGSLAHELGHAFDNMASEKKSSRFQYASDHNPGYESFEPINKTLNDMVSRIKKTDAYKKMTPKQRIYWSSKREVFARLFEAHVDAKARQNGITNTYLVKVPNAGEFSQLYPTQEELQAVETAIPAYLKEVSES